MMNMRIARPEHLIDLNDLAGLDFIRETDATIEIGAMTRHRSVERSELLTQTQPMLPAVAHHDRSRRDPRARHRRRQPGARRSFGAMAADCGIA